MPERSGALAGAVRSTLNRLCVAARRQALMRPIRAVAMVLFILWAVGQVARDRTWLTGLFFYVPSPVLAALCVVIGAIDAWRKRARSSITACLLAVPPGLAVGIGENHWVRPEVMRVAVEMPLRAVHWNVCHGRLGWDRAARHLAEQAAGVYVISEPPDDSRVAALASRLGPEYRFLRQPPFAIVAQGEILAPAWLVEQGHLRVLSFGWRAGGGSLRVFAVDHVAWIGVARDPGLRRLNELVAEHGPDLIVGDFNAPRLSLALSSLPEGYRHAYEAAGGGWSYTWPVPAPVYAIDQCIVGPGVRPLRHDLETRWCSDHRLQVLEFALRPAR